MTATSLVVNGFDGATLDLKGRLGGPGSLLNVASAAGFGTAGLLWGNVNLTGDATIEFASGQITSIAVTVPSPLPATTPSLLTLARSAPTAR